MTDFAVVDGHVLFAELLCGALSDHSLRAVGFASTAGEAVELVGARRPSLCLVDPASLPGEDGADVVERLTAAGAGRTTVVVITDDVDERAASAARSAGASYLHKGSGMVLLLDALVRVQRGEVVVRLPRRSAAPRAAGSAVHRLARTLTVRERECLTMLVDGATTAQMVQELGISVMTVRSHVRSVLCKLGVHSRLEAASLAVRHGLVETPTSDAG